MAEGKEIVIRIVNEEEKTTQQKSVDTVKGSNSVKKSTDDVFKSTTVAFLYRRTTEFAKNTIINEVKYQQGKYYRLADDYLGEQNMNIALNVISKVVSVATAAKVGLAVAGPVGAVAVVAMSAIGLGIQTAHNKEQEDIKLKQMNNQLQFNRQRAGYSLTAGSIGENR